MAFLKENAKDVHLLSYADHHYFVTQDLEEIKETFDNWNLPDKIIVTTEKDAARLHLHYDKLQAWGVTIAVIPIAVSVLFNKGYEFDMSVIRYVEQSVAENNEAMGIE